MLRSYKKFIPFIRTLLIMGIYIYVTHKIVMFVLSNNIIPNFTDLQQNSVFIAGLILETTRLLLGLILFRWVEKGKWKDFGFKFSIKDIKMSIIGIVIIFSLCMMFVLLTDKFNIAMWRKANTIVPLYLLYAVIIRGIMVGLSEEFLFRGYFFNAIKRYGRIVAYAVSGIFFVSIHFLGGGFSVTYLIDLITATILLIYIYDISGSIWLVAILHGAIDLFATLFFENLDGASLYKINFWHGEISYNDAIALVFTLINIVLFICVWLYYGHKLKIKKVEEV